MELCASKCRFLLQLQYILDTRNLLSKCLVRPAFSVDRETRLIGHFNHRHTTLRATLHYLPAFINFTRATLANAAGIGCRRVCNVCLSVCHESRYSSFLMPKISAKLKRGHPQRRRQMQMGWVNAGAAAANWRLSTRSVVNLARSQVYHTERPPYLFAARPP